MKGKGGRARKRGPPQEEESEPCSSGQAANGVAAQPPSQEQQQQNGSSKISHAQPCGVAHNPPPLDRPVRVYADGEQAWDQGRAQACRRRRLGDWAACARGCRQHGWALWAVWLAR